MRDHAHKWERGAHMAEAFGVDGRVNACAVCGVLAPRYPVRRAVSAPPAPEPRAEADPISVAWEAVRTAMVRYGDERMREGAAAALSERPQEPPAAADEAWAYLADDIGIALMGGSDGSEELIARHRPRIEASLATPPPLDAEVLAKAFKSAWDPDDDWEVITGRLGTRLTFPEAASEIAREYAAILEARRADG